MLKYLLIDLPAKIVDLFWYAHLVVVAALSVCAWIAIIETVIRFALTGRLN
ncbi:MAG TPA: hypothetical protein VHD57_00750 [Vicinamibacterales bacterium]|jgi:hypothetical protein|nr:hypothetical protein [Vicinamibacterales bacterium]